MTVIECNRCGVIRAGGGEVAVMAGAPCETGCGGKMRNRSKCDPWDEPETLVYYGVDPDDHGNRERRELTESVVIDADGDLAVTGYWR